MPSPRLAPQRSCWRSCLYSGWCRPHVAVEGSHGMLSDLRYDCAHLHRCPECGRSVKPDRIPPHDRPLERTAATIYILVASVARGAAPAAHGIHLFHGRSMQSNSPRQTITIGSKVTVEGPSPSQPSVVFEDDGETGYLYGLDFAKQDIHRDALHFTTFSSIRSQQASQVQLVWSNDGMKAALLINRYAHAVLDFAAKRGYCRTGFSTSESHRLLERRPGVG